MAERSRRDLDAIVVALLDRQLHPQGFSDQEEPLEG